MTSVTTDGVLERLTLHCNNLGLRLPPLDFDDDGDLLLTDALVRFCHAEGIDAEWLFTGKLRTPDEAFRDAISRLSDASKRRLLAAMKDHARNGGSIQDAARRSGFI